MKICFLINKRFNAILCFWRAEQMRINQHLLDGCSFCWEFQNNKSAIEGESYRVFYETKYFRVKFSLYEVTPNHLLIIPRRHFSKMSDMTFEEREDFFKVKFLVEMYYESLGIKAWNEGANFGHAAGQSLDHFHYHYFDRTLGDVPEELRRGGIRNFKPPVRKLGDYKDELPL